MDKMNALLTNKVLMLDLSQQGGGLDLVDAE
jgi:hypothetical protein